MSEYKICTRCIMDTSDPEITFDEQGICNHCHNFDDKIKPRWHPNEDGRKMLKDVVDRIKRENKDNEYDCIIGLSGGVDSSYLAYKAVEMGLRLLAVHVDAGWNSEIAVRNIENICKKLKLDLHTHVVDWEEVKELQRAFLLSGVANQDVPQDHAYFAALYNYAVKNNVNYVLSGLNFATEGILPSSWGYMAMDLRHLEGIYEKFGRMPLKTFPKVNLFKYLVYYPYVKKMKVIAPLNYMPYDKDEAIKTLAKEFNWQYYGGKHFESKFTKFFQAYYLPTKFGYDKRRAHLSSLIVSGQLDRETALREMEKELYPQDQLREDQDYVLRKLDITPQAFEELLRQPNKTYKDYPSNDQLIQFLRKMRNFIK